MSSPSGSCGLNVFSGLGVACNARRFVQAQEYANIPAPISRMPIFRQPLITVRNLAPLGIVHGKVCERTIHEAVQRRASGWVAIPMRDAHLVTQRPA